MTYKILKYYKQHPGASYRAAAVECGLQFEQVRDRVRRLIERGVMVVHKGKLTVARDIIIYKNRVYRIAKIG